MDNEFQFGKYLGIPYEDVIQKHPDYILWLWELPNKSKNIQQAIDDIEAAIGKDALTDLLEDEVTKHQAATELHNKIEAEYKEKAAKAIAEKGAKSGWVGAAKQRIIVRVSVDEIHNVQTQFGTDCTIFTFSDAKGNVYKWFTSSDANFKVFPNQVVDIKGTITKHSEWQGIKETCINRVKLLKSISKV